MISLTQRLARNDRRWTQPTPCRLGRSGEGEYVQNHGFGHEDWNFNARLAIDGYIYGYMYYRPRAEKKGERFRFAFLMWENATWHLVGFYHDAEYVPEGAPVDAKVLTTKVRHLRALGSSLGPEYASLSNRNMTKRLAHENQWLCWRVRPADIEVLPEPLALAASDYDARHYRITKPKEISQSDYSRLQHLVNVTPAAVAEPTDDMEFEEGALFTLVHFARERSGKLVAAAKERFLKRHGRLFCEACGFDFEMRYGKRGRGFIEAHHTVPISELTGTTLTRIKDLRMLCSNCHRMVHARTPWLSLDELQVLVATSQSGGA